MSDATPVEGRNGVAIGTRPATDGAGYRTYEVYQRERVGQSTEKIKPVHLTSEAYRQDPYPLLAILREHYPCYRDWLSNAYWISRYDDVTSVLADDANFETRPARWFAGLMEIGDDFGGELAVLQVEERVADQQVEQIAAGLAQAVNESGNLIRDFAARLPLELLAEELNLPAEQREAFYGLYWSAQRATSWVPHLQQAGQTAAQELIAQLQPLVDARRAAPGEDLISAVLASGGRDAGDVVATLLERDHETLHGALANLWYQLAQSAEIYSACRDDARLMKVAYLETLRHSTPVLSARRFARHEVERFGRLIPEGALLLCSAAAANRDARVFSEPDRFVLDRSDLCQREARGQYRADGLASGIAYGFGKPTRHPAIPEDRPRSRYAIARDTAVRASMLLASRCEELAVVEAAPPSSLSVGEMHACWRLLIQPGSVS